MANVLKNSGSRLEKIKRTRLPLSVWLAFLLVVTLTVGSTLARYNTSVSGDTTARVAKFEMATAVADGQPGSIGLQAGKADSEGTYSFTVTNNSEVLVKYRITAENVPANVKVTAQQGTNAQTITSTGGEMTFAAKELAMGAADDWTLTFQALDDAAAVSQQVTIKIHTEQVD